MVALIGPDGARLVGQALPRLRGCRCCEAPVDRQCLIGDCAVATLYGAVQGVVDVVLSLMAESVPDAFSTTEALPAPVTQGALLALAWVAAALLLRLYDPQVTRGRAAEAVAACAATWLGSVALTESGLYALGGAGFGPGPLDAAELNFFTGSITVLGGWRWIVWQTGGSRL